MGATAGLLLLQVPPELLSVSAIVCPTHTCVGPIIANGSGLTVTVVVAEHPARVYVITALHGPGDPPQIPEIRLMVAHEELLLLQVPPMGLSLNVAVNPAHKVVVPLIGAGVRLTVTVAVTVHPVPSV